MVRFWEAERCQRPILQTCGDGLLRGSKAVVIDAQPDLTLDEVVSVMRRQRISGSRTAVWRFFHRHKITFKKSLRAAEQERADVARARRRWMREQGMLDPSRLVFIDETSANTKMVRLNGRCRRGERLVGRCRRATGRPSPTWPLCVAMA